MKTTILNFILLCLYGLLVWDFISPISLNEGLYETLLVPAFGFWVIGLYHYLQNRRYSSIPSTSKFLLLLFWASIFVVVSYLGIGGSAMFSMVVLSVIFIIGTLKRYIPEDNHNYSGCEGRGLISDFFEWLVPLRDLNVISISSIHDERGYRVTRRSLDRRIRWMFKALSPFHS